MESMVKVLEMADIPTAELACIVKQGAILRLPYLDRIGKFIFLIPEAPVTQG